MSRHSWKEIRSTAAPETIERAELKTKAMLVVIEGQDQPDGREAREEIASSAREGLNRPE